MRQNPWSGSWLNEFTLLREFARGHGELQVLRLMRACKAKDFAERVLEEGVRTRGDVVPVCKHVLEDRLQMRRDRAVCTELDLGGCPGMAFLAIRRAPERWQLR